MMCGGRGDEAWDKLLTVNAVGTPVATSCVAAELHRLCNMRIFKIRICARVQYLPGTWLQGTDGPWAAEFASAVSGSPKIYATPAPEDDWWGSGDGNKWRGNRGPTHSVNFVTAHDGFSLADLVAFNEKHNDANGEQNRCLFCDFVSVPPRI